MTAASTSAPPSTLPGLGAVRAILSTLVALARNPSGAIGLFGVTFFVLVAFVGPTFVPIDTKAKLDKIYQLPSAEYLLGTDYQGRDVFSQIVHGGRDIIIVASTTALITTTIAVTLGALAGFLGGWFDSVVLAIADIILTIPQFPLLLVLATFVRLNNIVLLGVLLAALGWPALMRAIRSQVLSLRQRDYVEAARCLDLGTGHIVFRQILPSMSGYIAISFTLGMINAIFLQVGLIFLGLVPLSGNNWGVMLQLAWVRGAIFYKNALAYILAPVVAISLLQLSLIMLARSLEEIFNPRLRQGA
ncbi:MAG: ABC transporter permease [Chloroflexota bacterium]|jgi:peptide/nickel transport system permease protein